MFALKKIIVFTILLSCFLSGALLAQENQKEKPFSVIPEHFLREYDPITIFFNTRQTALLQREPIESFFKITPAHPGEYRWIDEQTLQFLPIIPWPALETIKIKIDDTATSSLITLMNPPRYTFPDNGSGQLEPIRFITLYFPGVVDEDKLAKMITLEISDLPGLDQHNTVIMDQRFFAIKALERKNIKDLYAFQLKFDEPIGYGKRLKVKMKLSLDPSLKDTVSENNYFTKPLFRITGFGCRNIVYPVSTQGSLYSKEQSLHCGDQQQQLFIQFSENPGHLNIGDIKRMVRFKPAVRQLTFHTEGKRLYLNFRSPPERVHQVSLNYIPIRSFTQRVLNQFDNSGFYFHYSKPESYLRWDRNFGVMERFGPKKFPMSGQGVERVDLRIYKLDPLDRRFWPPKKNALIVNEQKRPAGPGEVPKFDQNMAEHVKLLGSPEISKVITLPLNQSSGAFSFGLDLSDYLTDMNGQDQPGTFLVGFRNISENTQRRYVRIQVTDLSLSTIKEKIGMSFLVTTLKTAKPVAGANITVEAQDSEKEWFPVIQGKTDERGLYHYAHQQSVDQQVKRIIVKKDNDILIIDPEAQYDEYYNNFWNKHKRHWFTWLNQAPDQPESEIDLKAFVFTERPIYRPEEPVHVKGYVRKYQDGLISKTLKHNLKLVIESAGGKTWQYPLKLSDSGGFYIKFNPEKPPTGQFDVWVMDVKYGEIGNTRFSKESYQIPKFEVNLNGPDRVPLDQAFKVILSAGYYAGGSVAGQPVYWRATQFPYWYQPQAYKDFIFSTNRRFYSDSDHLSSRGSHQLTTTTDQNGNSEFTIDPTQEINSQPRQYVIEATLKGADERTVTSTKKVIALPSFMLGIKLDRLIKDSTTINPEILIIDHEGKPKAGVEYHLRLLQREWHSYIKETDFTTGKVEYVSDVVDKPVLEETFVSEAKAILHELDVQNSGVYIVEILARDKSGRLQEVSADTYLPGDTPMTWKKEERLIFDNVLDKLEYAPGETANLLIKSPYLQAEALVIVEKATVNDYHLVNIRNGTGEFQLKISSNMYPQIPVHVLLFKGRNGQRLTGASQLHQIDLFKPITKAATSWIKVTAIDQLLNLDLKHPLQSLPGSDVTFEIALTDPNNFPLDGEVTLWLVDQAVLSLAKEQELNPTESFLVHRDSRIYIRDTRNSLIGDLFINEHPGGDGEMDGMKKIMMAAMAEELANNVTVRKNFKTIAYYHPNIQVKDGQAIIKFKLPDNLTDFAVRAVAASGESRFGVAKSKLSIRLPLIVQPALPRFVRPGDSFIGGGIGRVVEGDGGEGLAIIKTEGLLLEENQQKQITWQPLKAEKLLFPLLVDKAYSGNKLQDFVKLQMSVFRNSDQASDAFEVKLPLKPDRSQVRKTSYYSLTKDQPLIFDPPTMGVVEGSFNRDLIVTHQPALLKMIAGLNYLALYPYGCTEQRISKIYPELVLQDTLDKIGQARRKDDLDREITTTLEFLKSVKHQDGLYGYWPGSNGYVSLTAYVVEFLALVKKLGYPFEPHLLTDGIRSLKKALRSDYAQFVSGSEYFERTSALYALAMVGELSENYLFDLYATAMESDLNSEARLLYVLANSGMINRQETQALTADLKGQILYRLINNQETYQGLQYRYNDWGGLVNYSETTTLATMTRALYRVEPDNEKTIGLMKELIDLGQGDGWGSTAANASALLTLNDYLKPDSLKQLSIQLSSQQLNQKRNHTADAPLMLLLNDKPDRLILSEPSLDGLQVMETISYMPAESGDKVTQESHGFVIDRELIKVLAEGQPGLKSKVMSGQVVEFETGDIIEEHIQVINPENRYYVAISVPFAAGLEPLNPNLKTAPPEAKAAGSFTQQPDYALYEDDQVTFYFDQLPKGSFDFYYRLKVITPGSFVHPAARAEMMYKQMVYGISNGCRIDIH
jgi:alpha-2-macroglobulin